MLCIVIHGPSFKEVHLQIQRALKYADLIELRLDSFEKFDFDFLKNLKNSFSIPMIFTLGSFKEGLTKRLKTLRDLAELQPEYLDLEYGLPKNFIEELSWQYPKVKIILSYHNFQNTPGNLEEFFVNMQKIPASFYKIATFANCSSDALRLLALAKKSKGNLIAIGMGPLGQTSRILGKICKVPITFATLEKENALGQINAQELIDKYHFKNLNGKTAILGLIGDPVSKSISDETHNRLIQIMHWNAVYVKILVKREELKEFLGMAQKIGFKGLSVTMPLKEEVLSFLDHIDQKALQIGAVNTLFFKQKKIIGFNTDAEGCLTAIENLRKVKGKKILLLGSGGVAKAILHESLARGGFVTIVNRNIVKARQLSEKYHCSYAEFPIKSHISYDILINCTPLSSPLSSDQILQNKLIVEINTKPQFSDLLREAQKKNCVLVFGYEIFAQQAARQFHSWFTEHNDLKILQKILKTLSKRILIDLKNEKA